MDEIQLCLILSLIPLARIDPCCPGGQSGQGLDRMFWRVRFAVA